MILVVVRTIRLMGYKSVKGTCIKVEKRQINSRGIFFHRAKVTFQYRFQGKTYLFREPHYSSSPRIQPGSTHKLYINPLMPSDCLTSSYNMTTLMLLVLCFGFVLMIFL